jgi:trimeric autotransporter adhesin
MKRIRMVGLSLVAAMIATTAALAFGAGIGLAANYNNTARKNVCVEGTTPPFVLVGLQCREWAAGLGATTGENDVAMGVEMMHSIINGSNNVALDWKALWKETTGSSNVAVGREALENNETGSNNVASGSGALKFNNRRNNAAYGVDALEKTLGQGNVGLGSFAGRLMTGFGSNNIDISNEGEAPDTGTTRVGTETKQTRAFMAGIAPTVVSGCEVKVTTVGQLGVGTPSECNDLAGATGATGVTGATGQQGGLSAVTKVTGNSVTSGMSPPAGTDVGPSTASCSATQTLVGGGAQLTNTGLASGATKDSFASATTLGGFWTANGVAVVSGGPADTFTITAFALCAS